MDLVYALEEGAKCVKIRGSLAGDCEERDGALQLIAAISESQPEIGRQLLPQVLSALDDPAQKALDRRLCFKGRLPWRSRWRHSK